MPEEHVLKVYVFDKVRGWAARGSIPETFQDLPVDVEQLPVQVIRPERPAAITAGGATGEAAAGVMPQRQHQRPIPGGVSISPLGAEFVGTLGCFLRRRRVDTEEIFALSNNHVLADVDRLPPGTPIVQPGPEAPPYSTHVETNFATLQIVLPIRFPTAKDNSPINRFDAAVATITDTRLIQTGAMFGAVRYDPVRVDTAVPGMRVVKVGRTTGITRGQVTAVGVDGIEVNYGTPSAPRIAVYDGAIVIAAVDADHPFSLPGDSGSVILEENMGHPLALLFAGDGFHTTACDLGPLCRKLSAWPI
ncbi:MAG: hypothetical protein ACR2PL_08965 [Dehalococcoidia bacterium]